MISRDAFSYEEKSPDKEYQCSNCKYFDPEEKECEVFCTVDKLNLFEVDEEVSPGAYCKAWAEGDKVRSMDDLKRKRDESYE